MQFRVAMFLKSSQHNPEPIVSAPSVVILTRAEGLPTSAPVIVRAAAVDSYGVSVSWEPGPFPNGPLLSYVLRLQWDNHTQLKVYATPELYRYRIYDLVYTLNADSGARIKLYIVFLTLFMYKFLINVFSSLFLFFVHSSLSLFSSILHSLSNILDIFSRIREAH